MKFNLVYLLTFVVFVTASAIPGPKAVDSVVSDKHLLVRDDGICHTSVDCEGGLCWEGICIDSRCRHNGDCPDDYYCFRGNCNPIPGRERDVKTDVSDTHLLERDDRRCQDNGDCPNDYYCFRGNCNKIPRWERDVDADQVTKSDDTVDAEMCPIDVTDTDLEAPPTPCKHDKDCKRCLHCIKGYCGHRHGKTDDESELMGSDGK